MRKFLSVLLAVMMVVSTVSFAVPSAVTVADYATNAVVEYTTEEATTEEMAALSAESDYGTLVFNIDFEKDGISFTKNKSVAVNTITDNYNSEICPSGIVFYPNSMDEDPQLVTDANGNTYLNYTNTAATAGYRFFQISETDSTLDWKDGTFTVLVDYYYTGGLNSIAFHINSSASYNAISPVVYKHNTWQTAVGQYTSQLGDFYIAPGYAANYTNSFGVDNIRLYYSAESVNLTIKADNATTGISDGIVAVNRTTGMTVSDIVANANMADLIGIAETKNGTMLSASTVITPVYAKSYYGVFGYDVNLMNNGNSAVSTVTVEDIDTRKGITVGELLKKITNNSGKQLRGLSLTPDGDPLAENTVITSETPTLYMVWPIDQSQYGTLLFDIDFENYDAGYEINGYKNNNNTAEFYDADAITNGEFSINWQLNDGGKVTVDSGNKYLRGNKAYAQIRVKNSNYNAAYSPMPKGVYTLIADVIDFGTASRKMAAIAQVSSGNHAATIVDGWSGKTNDWDTVIAQWDTSVINTSDMTWYFTDAATTEVGFDNVKLYYQPSADATFSLKVDANDNSAASSQYIIVKAGDDISANGIKGAMSNSYSGCIGVAETPNGDIIPQSATFVPKYNQTYYAVWGFDVKLLPGQNSAMTAVTVSNIDTRRGTTIGNLLASINNTTDRKILGLSTSSNGEILDVNTAVTKASQYYIIWELEESEFGTLIAQIDFEREGITAPVNTVKITDIASVYNEDLTKGNVNFVFGKNSAVGLDNSVLVNESGNTYLEADANTTGAFYSFIEVNEWSDDVEWRDGTYTYIFDVKHDKPFTQVAMHLNNNNADTTILDDVVYNKVNEWDTVAIQYKGVVSANNQGNGFLSGNFYVATNMGAEGGKLAIDNVRIYFKTEETIITVKPNGNRDLSDVVVPVSTTEGITVAELIAEVKKHSTRHTLLGISTSATGELLSEDTRIIPDYQQTYYAIWNKKGNNPMIDDNLGKLLFAVDFERQDVIDANWNGMSGTLENNLDSRHGAYVANVASLYDKEIFNEDTNFRISFVTNDGYKDYFNAGIKTSPDGKNHYLEGYTGIDGNTTYTKPDGSTATVKNGSKWPQVIVGNNAHINLGNGVYTVFIDAMGPAGSFDVHGELPAQYKSTVKKINPDTLEEEKWVYKAGEWGHYAYSFEINDNGEIPNKAGAYFSFAGFENTVAFDNYKLYYKPFTATITLNAGDYPEFGETKVEGISTTGENTGADIVAAIQADLDVCGREFVGLMDEYGEMLDLDEALVIPGDVTYTIVWGEENEYAPVTWNSNSIRYSTNVNSRGIRFAADTAVTATYDATEYGWVIARTDVLEKAGVKATSLTKESFDGASNKVIVGKNYDKTVDAYDRKHFSEDDSKVVITAVIYGVPEKYYRYEFTVRPYIVIDGVHYYGKPWSRSIYDTAVAMKDAGYPECDKYLINYIDTIIANTPAAE